MCSRVSLARPTPRSWQFLPGGYPGNYDPAGIPLSMQGSPTSRADARLLGTGADSSDAARNRYYKTANNLPFALDIPTSWRYPLATVPIVNGYLSFAPWAESGGALKQDWYLTNTIARNLY